MTLNDINLIDVFEYRTALDFKVFPEHFNADRGGLLLAFKFLNIKVSVTTQVMWSPAILLKNGFYFFSRFIDFENKEKTRRELSIMLNTDR